MRMMRLIIFGLKKISHSLQKLKPDILIILGDRYEAFAGAFAALCLRIPIAHIHGGEKTIGSLDDAFRHSITKLSNYHFVSTNEYKKRFIKYTGRLFDK